MRTKQPHYIPQFLLRHFRAIRDSNQVWVYDKRQDQIRLQSISKVARQNNFYNIKIDATNLSLESYLYKLEGDASKVINKIVESKRLDNLTADNRKVISEFIVVQLMRTPSFRSRILKAAKILSQEYDPNFTPEDRRILTDLPAELPKQLSIKWIRERSKNFSEILMRKIWTLRLASGEQQFLISDHPVVLIWQEGISKGDHINILEESVICLPLSNRLLLTLLPSRFPNQIPADTVNTLDATIINNLNAMQVFGCERFIFAHDNNLTFIKQIIQNNPNSKFGPLDSENTLNWPNYK